MRKFDYNFLKNRTWDNEILSYVAKIHEYKGKQEFYCTYTKCGLCTLAKKEHMETYLPCLCRMDYQTYDMVGAKLIRNHTLAKGDSCCDFHVVRKKDI